MKLPEYKCHKTVQAAKITAITAHETSSGYRIELGEFGNIERSNAWFVKFEPEVGGYIVEYGDGYISYSPANVFDAGYRIVGDTLPVDRDMQDEVNKLSPL